MPFDEQTPGGQFKFAKSAIHFEVWYKEGARWILLIMQVCNLQGFSGWIAHAFHSFPLAYTPPTRSQQAPSNFNLATRQLRIANWDRQWNIQPLFLKLITDSQRKSRNLVKQIDRPTNFVRWGSFIRNWWSNELSYWQPICMANLVCRALHNQHL